MGSLATADSAPFELLVEASPSDGIFLLVCCFFLCLRFFSTTKKKKEQKDETLAGEGAKPVWDMPQERLFGSFC